MPITWTESADKHGFSHAQAVFAMANAHYRVVAFDEPRVPHGIKPDLFIGPAWLGGPLLEVLAEVSPPRIHVFHVMELRQKTLDRMENDDET